MKYLGLVILCVLFIVFSYFEFFKEDTETVTQNIVQATTDNDPFSIVDRRGVDLGQNFAGQGLGPLLTEIQSTDLLNNQDIKLSIDSELQSYVYRVMEEVALNADYVGGAGVMMDIKTGEILAMVSYPEFQQNNKPSINKVTNGLYVPGSVVKPFVAIGALSEEIISPEKEILSTGSIELPNPYQGGDFLVFNDWKAHGYVDMRKAIGVSSNVYFYAVGGGYENQRGLGIEKVEEYLRMFGVGGLTGIDILSESEGVIPNPKWKEKKYNGASWRLGDTYLASIGQHGYEVTPLQLVRAATAIATNGQLVTPSILHKDEFVQESTSLPIKASNFNVVKEGMEYAVINGTAAGLYMDGLSVAAKTGTAEVDTEKEYIHSWVIGYFPHDKPRYAFTFFLEQGPWGEEVGSVAVASDVLTWIRDNRPEYFTQF
ncbi:MAG: penicillin-binding protein 2 [Candidatus Paceibacteria bacterium]|jgi:penicillin-binding protein 2